MDNRKALNEFIEKVNNGEKSFVVILNNDSSVHFMSCKHGAAEYYFYCKQYEVSKFDMVVSKLSAMGFKFEILNHNSGNFAIRVYYDESDDYTVITPSDDNREDYVCVAGIVQNFNEWLMRGK